MKQNKQQRYLIEKTEIKNHLEALGQKISEPCYLRFFFGKGDPRKREDRGRKASRLNSKNIQMFQDEGRGVHFVVNGGGHKNEDIKQARAIFVEHDHLGKEIQETLWKTLNLPQPTLQVDSGGRSIHNYWVFDTPIPINQWKNLQLDLLEYTDGDKNLKSPAHTMRLAGCWHTKVEDGKLIYSQSKIILNSGKKYSFEELRKVIPKKERKESLPLSLPKFTAIPLLSCCSTEVRGLINTGVPEGSGRNEAAIKVAMELIGVERWLQKEGQAYTDTASALFADFGDRSGMYEQEVEERWKWVNNKHDISPSLDEEKLKNCVRAQIKQTSPNSKPYQHPVPIKDKTQALTAEQTLNKLEDLASTHFDSEIEAELAKRKIIEKSVLSEWAIKDILSRQSKIFLTRAESAKLNKKMEASKSKLDYWRVIPELANSILEDAQQANCDPLLFLLPLLTSVLGMGGVKTNLSHRSYETLSNLYAMVVAPVSSGKSRGQRAINKGLKPIQEQYHEVYVREYENYEYELIQWQNNKRTDLKPKKPKRQKLYVTKSTPEALVKHAGNQVSHGLIYQRDEILGLFQNLNGYSGKSDGQESVLELWDEPEVEVNRVNEDDCYKATASLSIYGGIQPLVLDDFFNDKNAANGTIARFIIARVHRVRAKARVDADSLLDEVLTPMFRFIIENFNHSISYSDEAAKLIDDYRIALDNEAHNYQENAIEAGWLNKAICQTDRFAIALLMISSYFDNTLNRTSINVETASRAIILTEYFKDQFLSIVSEFYEENDGDLSSVAAKVLHKAMTEPNGLTLRAAVHRIYSIRKLAQEDKKQPTLVALDLFRELEKRGKGKVTKEGRTYKFETGITQLFPQNITDGFEVGCSVYILPMGTKGTVVERTVTEQGDKVALTDRSKHHFFLADLRPDNSQYQALSEMIERAFTHNNQSRLEQFMTDDYDFFSYQLNQLTKKYGKTET